MSSHSSRSRLSLLFVAIGLAGAAALIRRFSLHRAAEVFGTKIPRGAMAIRRESLVDLTTDGRPVRQTVFIAEAAGEMEIVAGEVEELDPLDVGELPEPDPGDSNSSGTITDVAPTQSVLSESEGTFTPEELHAEAEAVLAEADRIEEEASDSQLIEDEIAEDEALEESFAAEEVEGVPEAELIAESEADVPAAAAIEPIEDEIADAEIAEEEGSEEAVKAQPMELPKAGKLRVSAKKGACPDSHPIKVRFATGRYHEPGTATYDYVVADACYANVQAAEADGFSASPL